MGCLSHVLPDGGLPELFMPDRWRCLTIHLALSPRQREVAWLACRGMTVDTMAFHLSISPHTVRMHLKALFKRLDVHDRVGLVVRLVLADRELVLPDNMIKLDLPKQAYCDGRGRGVNGES